MGNAHGRRRKKKDRGGSAGGDDVDEERADWTAASGKHKSASGGAGRDGGGGGGASGMLTDEQIKDIQLCWPHLETKLNDILTDAFISLFNDDHVVKERFFRSKSMDDDSGDDAGGVLTRHVPSVARAVTKVVRHVADLDSVADYLQVMGKLHHQRGIPSSDLGKLGPHVVSSSLCHLPSHLRERKQQETWIRFFVVLADLMRRGYPEIAFELSPQEKALIRSTFKTLRAEVDEVGESTVIKLFRTHSSTAKTLDVTGMVGARDSTPDEEVALVDAMDNHGMLLFKMAADMVEEMDTKGALEEKAKALGRFHEAAGVRKQYLDVMGPIFCQSVRPVLQANAQWDDKTREAWLRFFRVVAFHMRSGYTQQQQKKANKKQNYYNKKKMSVGELAGKHHQHFKPSSATNANRTPRPVNIAKQRLSLSETNSPVRSVGANGSNGKQSTANGVGSNGHPHQVVVVADVSRAMNEGSAADKRRGRSVDDSSIGERRVKMPPQHCHLFTPSGQQHVANPRFTSSLASSAVARRRIAGSSASINEQHRTEPVSRTPPKLHPQQNRLYSPQHHQHHRRASGSHLGFPGLAGGIQASRSDVDLATQRRVSAGGCTGFFMLSPGDGFGGFGVTSALLTNANAAAAEAKAEKRRRSSLHQLFGLAVNGSPGKGKGGKQQPGVHRPRSKSTTLVNQVK